MKPITFPGCNTVLTKPNEMTDEQCGSLEAMKGTIEGGIPYFITAWQPSQEDIDAINQGRPIYLQVISFAHPPVSVYTTNENNEINE